MIHLLYGLEQIEADRQEACIHCKAVWYASKHKDHVCHVCQKKGLPGRSAILARAGYMRLTGLLLALIAGGILTYHKAPLLASVFIPLVIFVASGRIADKYESKAWLNS